MDQDQARCGCLMNPIISSLIADQVHLTAEYMDELGENIDGLVIGGYWGQGNRGGVMASYLIGLSAVENGKTM